MYANGTTWLKLSGATQCLIRRALSSSTKTLSYQPIQYTFSEARGEKPEWSLP